MKRKSIFLTLLSIIGLIFLGVFIFIDTSQIEFHPKQIPQSKSLPDFSKCKTVQEKIISFKKFLKPIADAENGIILSERTKLTKIRAKSQFGKIKKADINWLNKRAKYYCIDEFSCEDKEDLITLGNRMDIIPTPMILSQAAIESGWGSSGFSRKYNNLFGLRTFDQRNGVVPRQRAQGGTFRVAKYKTVNQSVKFYLKTLNTVGAYKKLRRMREQFRENHEPINPFVLAEGLVKYSDLGNKYVRMVQATMKHFYNEDSKKVSEKKD